MTRILTEMILCLNDWMWYDNIKNDAYMFSLRLNIWQNHWYVLSGCHNVCSLFVSLRICTIFRGPEDMFQIKSHRFQKYSIEYLHPNIPRCYCLTLSSKQLIPLVAQSNHIAERFLQFCSHSRKRHIISITVNSYR